MEYTCTSSFTSSKGKPYMYSDEISAYEYNGLLDNEKRKFTKNWIVNDNDDDDDRRSNDDDLASDMLSAGLSLLGSIDDTPTDNNDFGGFGGGDGGGGGAEGSWD